MELLEALIEHFRDQDALHVATQDEVMHHLVQLQNLTFPLWSMR